MIVGVILAGGAGSRIGGAKAMAMLAGAPLITHAARALTGAAALAVSGDAAAAQAIGANSLADPPGMARGPLAGILAGLDWCARVHAHWLAVAPCDAPFLPHDIVTRLREAAGEGALACAESEQGLEPLISIWRADLAADLRAALSQGRHPPVHEVLRALGAAQLALSRAEVMNINTPVDLALAQSLLTRE